MQDVDGMVLRWKLFLMRGGSSGQGQPIFSARLVP